MRPWSILALLALLIGCSDPEPPSRATASPTAEASASAPETGTEPGLIALRRYESLVNGQRSGTLEVRWFRLADGRIKDITRTRNRWARMMGRVRTIFESETDSKLLRTADGELLLLETETRGASRTDRSRVQRTETGYDVTMETGANTQTFAIETEGPTQVDVETFLGPKIRSGEAKPGTAWTYSSLATRLRKVIEVKVTVIGPDDEGPGLQVVESALGHDTLWWFADDGSVVRMRAQDSVLRRDDSVGLDDLPARPASWRITLPVNVSLPRIFTGRTMLVDIEVETDETTHPPKIPENPFTEVIEEKDGVVRARLRSYDNPAATTTLPIDPKGLEEHLEPTPLMEVDSPVLQAAAREIVGRTRDARTAARRIADYVFTRLKKRSPEDPEPTALQIHALRTGDCSEHALYFTALCRAAGIPARRCSGWVCIGDDWGTHAWCEIWLGEWIGADPTTNEIGTRARYIFLRRPEDREMVPGTIVPARTEIWIRRAEYDDGALDFEDDEDHDLAVYSGIRIGPLPDGWRVSRTTSGIRIRSRAVQVWASIAPDHGYRSPAMIRRFRLPGGEDATLGPSKAVVRRFRNQTRWIVPLGREILMIQVRTEDDAEFTDASLAKIFLPTLKRDDG
ncbi:MAG: transglutaminase-like domain-containing protein [Planctomycetota bacterium]